MRMQFVLFTLALSVIGCSNTEPAPTPGTVLVTQDPARPEACPDIAPITALNDICTGLGGVKDINYLDGVSKVEIRCTDPLLSYMYFDQKQGFGSFTLRQPDCSSEYTLELVPFEPDEHDSHSHG